jgi:ubiquinone/menaquinone biosynthesis C-methylase UbiE
MGKAAHGPSPIRLDATVLDLGAGTGNITKRLVMDSTARRVLALDKNKDMLNILRQKCVAWLRDDFERPGVMAIRQDMTSLKGIDEELFDYVIINNVLYSIDTPAAVECLEGARRLLKKGGEIRVSGPRKDTDLDQLFRCIENDLRDNGRWKVLEKDYRKVAAINYKYLAPMLKRWSVDDVKDMLFKSGFTKISHVTEKIYAGQSMVVCAIK